MDFQKAENSFETFENYFALNRKINGSHDPSRE